MTTKVSTTTLATGINMYDCGYHPEHRGELIAAGESLYDMRVRLTLDLDFLIHAAAAVSDHTPFPVCGQAAQAMQKLVG